MNRFDHEGKRIICEEQNDDLADSLEEIAKEPIEAPESQSVRKPPAMRPRNNIQTSPLKLNTITIKKTQQSVQNFHGVLKHYLNIFSFIEKQAKSLHQHLEELANDNEQN